MPSKLKLLMNTEYKARFEKINSMVFFDYQKILANDFRVLRKELEEQNISVVIVHNRVFLKVLANFGTEELKKVLVGPIAVAYGENVGEVIKAAKFLYKYYRANNSCEIKGGIMDGVVDDAKAAKKYKDMLTREETLSMISGQLLAMGSRIASQIIGPASLLASQIEKKGEE